jgi:hypothetical protein
MSSILSSHLFKDHVVGALPPLLATIISSSTFEALPAESDIDRLKKEVEEFSVATRKQAGRYQKDLENLVSKHGTADQARRRDVQKTPARRDEGEPASQPYIHLLEPLNSITSANIAILIDSSSESDVPLRRKRKLDDSSRASTPRLATPKGKPKPLLHVVR